MVFFPASKQQPLQFLVIDNSPNCRKLLTELFAIYGIETIGVGTAKEALDLLWEQRVIPDLLVSEIRLPRVDGCSLIHDVKAFARANNVEIPTVALTVYGSDHYPTLVHLRHQILAAGFDRYFSKPVDIRELMWSIAHLLNQPQILATDLPA